jgi:hypothetical protein
MQYPENGLQHYLVILSAWLHSVDQPSLHMRTSVVSIYYY